jgi:xanthine phosphoribosyltransferase
MPTVVDVTYTRVAEYVEHLAQQIRGRGASEYPRGIVPVARGGLIPGAMLAYKLGIHDIWPVKVSTYRGQLQTDQSAWEIYIPERLETIKGEGYLILDDIVDSGVTMQLLHQRLPLAKRAALYSKTGLTDVDFHAAVGTKEFWYNFPWEGKED